MGLKNGSSAPIRLTDLEYSWKAFEEMNQVKVAVQIANEVSNGVWCLTIRSEAWGKSTIEQAPMLLASESVRCSASDYLSLDVALFRLLYALDVQLASRELAETNIKKA